MNDNHKPAGPDEAREARWTAYALGELDAAERRAVEAEMSASADARQYVAETQAVAGQVRKLAEDEAARVAPSPSLRRLVETKLEHKEAQAMAGPMEVKRETKGGRRRILALVAGAAALLILVSLSAVAVREIALAWRAGSPRSFHVDTAGAKGNLHMADDVGYDNESAAYDEARGGQVKPTIDALRAKLDSAEDDLKLEREAHRNNVARLKQERATLDKFPGAGLPANTPAVPSQPKPEQKPMARPAEKPAERPHGLAVGDQAAKQSQTFPGYQGAMMPGPGYDGSGATSGGKETGQGSAGLQPKPGIGRPTPRPARPGTEGNFEYLMGPPGGSPGKKPTRPEPAPGQPYGNYPSGAAMPGMMTQGGDATADSRIVGRKMADPGQNPVEWHENLGGAQDLVPAPGTEQYDAIQENPYLLVSQAPQSTFSIDVDTASYANVRRFLNQRTWPPRDAVRIEEMVNYFHYGYPLPQTDAPFSASMEVAQCPWSPGHRLLRVGLKGREIDRRQRGLSNLVFLLDVSGSMSSQDKLPLAKQAMTQLVGELDENDRVAIVTYAGATGVHLESTVGHDKDRILKAIDRLSAGGSTNGGAGIQLAYQQAVSYFIKGGVNRVIWCTDGDLNVGITRDEDLVKLIEDRRQSGVFLTVLGFGTGNLKDSKLEKLADHGNGLYAYIDSIREARKVLVEQLTGSLITIAKDVKIQIEFNPAQVAEYRLIGYENRVMAAEDFANDKKDAGEIGAGHTVTALYELIPAANATRDQGPVEEDRPAPEGQLKYQRERRAELTQAAQSGELLTLSLRYKEPDGEKSKLLQFTLKDEGKKFGQASKDFQFAAAVAQFGMLLRGSRMAGQATLSAVEEIAASALGDDPGGYRAEFVDLVRKARELQGRP